jgi:hypothetical protein
MIRYTILFVRLAALLLLPFTACAKDIPLNWTIKQYTDQSAIVGDTVTFTWSGSHNVYIHPNKTDTCDKTERTEVSKTSGKKYTFKTSDVGVVVFACDKSGHCAAGQIVKFNVTAPANGGGAGGKSPSDAPSDIPSESSDLTPEPTPAPTAATTPSGGGFGGKHICLF